MCKRRNKILSMLLGFCMMLSSLMPLSTNIASAASDGNNQEVIMNEDGVPTTYKVGGIDYELVKGAFNYTSAEYEEMSSYFYYSDGYFAQSPEYYNEHFASFAASMALASMPCCYEGEYSEENSTKYIVNMFNAMGYTDIFVHYPEPKYFGEDAENLSTIGYAIAKKKIVVNGTETTVIAIGTRGLDYRAEWASNVTLGSGTGEAKGFGDAARQVKEGIDTYIADKGIDADSATFFITGYSRAGATSNLVAKKLTDEYGENKVYAYCFEAPKGGVASEMKPGHTYANIHNVINEVDIVPTVGPAQMGFIRYGVDHIVPGYEVGTDGYNEQKALMLAQLAAINPNIVVDDTFHEATMEFVGSTIGYYNMISPEFFPDYDTAEEWIPVFIEKLQEYSMTDMRDKVVPPSDQQEAQLENQYKTDGIFDRNSNEWMGYRNFYSNYMWYIYFDETDGNKVKIKSYVDAPDDFASGEYKALTLEDAIANLMMFYFGMPADRMAELTDVLGGIDPDTIMNGLDMTHIWWSVIDDWREFKIDTKNEEFHKIWAVVNKGFKPEEGQTVSTKTLEAELKKVLNDEEYETLLASLYVIIDFALDFVSEDYNITDSNLLGTLLYNIGNIMQTHYNDVTYAWVRSYDSFYKVNSDDVIRLHGLKADGSSILIGGYSTFEEGWEAAVDFAEDHDYMDGNKYERIVVDLLADWNANEKGEFVKSRSDGFKNSTIYVPSETYITINLNQRTINRGLGDRNELDGEVIFVAEEANLIINGGTISGGNSDNGAGGIHIDDEATVTLNNVHVKGNTVDGDDGGGIALYDGATLIMNGGSISDNRNNSFNGDGAGVYVCESTAIFEGVTFRNNQNTYHPMLGTVLFADEDSVVTMNNCTVVDNGTFNEANGTVGSISLIQINADSSVEIKNTEFRGNGYASSNHSSYYVNSLINVEDTSHFLIDDCTFKHNSAAYILCVLGEDFEVVDTRFLDNPANVFYGYAKNSSTFTNCEFNNNSGNQWKGYYSFNFISTNSKVKFVNCSGDSTYNDRSRATFEDDSKVSASLFGEGSLALIVAFVALIASIASIIVNVTERKKKTGPVTATEQSEDDK